MGQTLGESEHGAVYSRKWSPGVLSVSGGVLRTPSPHASTRWLGHRIWAVFRDGLFSSLGPVRQIPCPLLFQKPFPSAGNTQRPLSVESQIFYWWFLQPWIPFQNEYEKTHTFNFKDLSQHLRILILSGGSSLTSSKCLVPNKPFIFPIFRRSWACTGCFNEQRAMGPCLPCWNPFTTTTGKPVIMQNWAF